MKAFIEKKEYITILYQSKIQNFKNFQWTNLKLSNSLDQNLKLSVHSPQLIFFIDNN